MAHDPAPDLPLDREGFKAFWRQFRTAFPDLSVKVNHLTPAND